MPLQRELKDLIGKNKPDEVFRRLREEVLHSKSELYNKVILLENRYQQGKAEGELGLIDFKEKSLRFNNVHYALLWCIDEIAIADLSDNLRLDLEARVCIPEFHSLSCDRSEQSGMVQLHFYEHPDQKIRHFYLYGDARQALRSLHKRLGYDLGGQLLNWRDGNYQAQSKVRFVVCKPPIHQMPKLFLINIYKELLAQFYLDTAKDILARKLSETLHSPVLKGDTPANAFGENDFVFVLLTLDHHNWNERITPEVVKNFIESFCACELPPDAPNFFFFYGIEYQKENEAVRQSVEKAIRQAEYGEKLEPLLPVPRSDVAEWLSRYDLLVPKGQSADDLAAKLFPNTDRIDMDDIEIQLLRLIDQHNKGLVPDF